jgi:hypothetical protein
MASTTVIRVPAAIHGIVAVTVLHAVSGMLAST